jgi:hypothetical protein
MQGILADPDLIRRQVQQVKSLKAGLDLAMLERKEVSSTNPYECRDPSKLMLWNHLGFNIIFSCQENIAFQRSKKTFVCC